MIRINLLPKRSIMFHVKHWLERVGVLVANEPYVTPTHKYWYYHCWYPPSRLSDKGVWKVPGGYGFELEEDDA